MSERESATWTGKQYKYWIYQLPAKLDSGQDGNYIYAKVSGEKWQPIYIGQGDLGDRSDIDNHHQSACLKRKEATHFHAHKNASEADRRAEEKDLLSAHPEAYQPTGCNEKEGG